MHGRLTAPVLALALLAAGPVPARAAEPEIGCVEIPTRAPNNLVVKFWYRVPFSYDPSRRELGFAKWAVARGWCLVAPSFAEDGWWEPARGSAEVLRLSVEALRRRHGIRPLPVFLYGYSAGGQLAALLQSASPFPVAAWAVHGCGVFPEPQPRMGAPALVSCGVDDEGRFTLGRTFACRYREAGGPLVWKPTKGGHAPDATALALARALFAAVASGAPCARWGEDDTRRLAPREAIDPEYLNPLYDGSLADLWRRDAP